MADMLYGASAAGDLGDETNNDFYGGIANANTRQRYPGLYVGNLTWWTTDQDVINAINSVGVNDVQEVKFFENRNNGQSKGFCVVTFGSEAPLPIVMEKLPKLELYGQNPVVTPYNRQNLNLFESQTKTRTQINSNNGPNPHAAGIMGISSISGIHANTQGLPYSGLNTYNQGAGVGGQRAPSYPNMRMQMRTPRPMMRGSLPNAINNGPMLSGGHQMNRMRFIQPQAWNNSQAPYNPANRIPQVNMDLSTRLGMGGKPEDSGISQDMLPGIGTQNYYTPHHPSSQSDHYRNEARDLRDLRDDRDSIRRSDDRPMRQDDRSLRHDDRPIRQDDRSLKQDERSSSRRDERSSRREEGSSSRRDEGSSRRDEGSSRRDDRSSRREEKTSRREKSHRSDDRVRSRSRDRSRERKERRDRRDRY